MVETRNEALASALVQCFTAQPYVVELIDTVALFTPEMLARDAATNDEFDLLVTHLRQIVHPGLEQSQEEQERRDARLALVQRLLLNKRKEARKQQ